MLKSFEMTNFKSFKTHTKINLEKTNYQTLLGTNVKNNVVKGAMFVGANASGKTNILLAIKFLLDCLFGKSDINFNAYFCIFSKDSSLSLKYTFLIDNSEIIYEITYQRIDEFVKEKLKVDGKVVFVREASVANVSISEELSFADVPNNTLFLRDVYFNTKFRGNTVLQHWFDFLSNSVYLDLYAAKLTVYKALDLSLETYMEEDGAKQINSFFDELNFNQHIEYDKSSRGRLIKVESPEKMIYFKRKGIEEPIPFVLESLGNRNLLELLPSFFHCIENGGMLILDEFSSGFHNDLEELLVKYFMKKSDWSQLFFVSHSTNLLSNSLLRPDQLYSVDFGNEGSYIKRFSSERPREAQNLEKMYLAGVFDGVPNYESNF